MSSSTAKPSSIFPIPQHFLLQIGTTSILILLIGEKAYSEALKAMGQASEEIFRGESLPILNFTDVPKDNSN